MKPCASKTRLPQVAAIRHDKMPTSKKRITFFGAFNAKSGISRFMMVPPTAACNVDPAAMPMATVPR